MSGLLQRLRCGCLGLAVFAFVPALEAQVDLGLLLRSAADPTALSPLRVPGTDRVSALVRVPPGAAPVPELVTIAPGLAAFEGSLAELAELGRRAPALSFSWAPARPLLVDRASQSLRAPLYRSATGATGRGTVIGIVDSGLDLDHLDLQNLGATRVAWLLDLARPPAGRQPELEAQYSCSAARPCAVFSAADIDELRANATGGDLPGDAIGHGTHVASLAAGNGESSADRRYAGVAPEATLIVVRAVRAGVAGVFDADMLLSTRFVFERAAELGMPAVVNLSLGGDFGNHDGSSLLEQGLASFVGEQYPGRAIVVAAGNSGGLIAGLSSDYPDPLGVHTEVHVPPASSVRVPILTLPGATAVTAGSLAIWIAGRPGDRLDVGLDGPEGELVAPLPPGKVAVETSSRLSVNLINGLTGSGSDVSEGLNAAMLLVDGEWSRGATFALRFSGNGSPRLWVQASTNAAGGGGALFPRATREGTITIPATSEALIAVGASLNRLAWVDHSGTPISIPSSDELSADSATSFSSAGPTADGRLKPDIVAPGAFVVGAMASGVDPRAPGVQGSMFDQPSYCAPNADCLVVDDDHAISTGTSMAAPLVSGAIALLFERNPTLTQPELRGLLQAGARPLSGGLEVGIQAGAGTLDLERTLEAATYLEVSRASTPSPGPTFMVLAESYAHPDPDWPLRGLIVLRDEAGHVADGFDEARLELHAEPAERLEPPARIAPGAFEFAVYPRAGSGGQTLSLRLTFDGEELESRRLPLAVDRWVASEGYAARGGCALGGPQARAPRALWLVLLGALLAARRSQLGQIHRAARRLERSPVGIERMREIHAADIGADREHRRGAAELV